jgi:hypothetical protein
MPARGPVPKRSDQRRRTNEPAGGPVEHAPGGEPVIPKGNPKWHPIAKRWFESLKSSGQSVYYESSDWALAEVTAEEISRLLRPRYVGFNEKTGEPVHVDRPMGTSFAAVLKGMGALLATEADRRRVSLELERVPAEGQAAPVSWIDEARRKSG